MIKRTRIFLHGLRKFLNKLIKSNGISALVSLLLIVLIWRQNSDSTSLVDWLDLSVLSSVVFALLITSISVTIEKIIVNQVEDANKLTQDYDTLSASYVDDLFTYENSIAKGVNPDNLKILLKTEGHSSKGANSHAFKTQFPIANVTETYNKTLVLHDSNAKYELPPEIEENYNDIILAHEGSTNYNQLVIRVNDWVITNNSFHLFTSRSTYFNSLVTNRAMDYEWNNGITNRKLYDYGPFITPLKESKLSNHIGYNGFVESEDGYIPFMYRNKNVSMAKKTYSPGVTASLKAKYALNNKHEFTLDGLKTGIIKEINDELKIKKEDLVWENLNQHLISFYRDMVEGGKPQFMFHIKSTKTKDEINVNFEEHHQQKKKRDQRFKNHFNLANKMLEDGNKLIWIPKNELKSLAISPGLFVHNQNKYASVPSYTSNIVMLIKHLEDIGEI